MKTKQKRKLRLRGRDRVRLERPKRGEPEKNDKSFYLRVHEEADGRYSVVKIMRQRLERLLDDAGADTEQKRMLCGRASFLAAMLESMEVEAFEGKKINIGRYVQACNGLSGTLSRLGIDKQLKKEIDTLESYVAKKKARD